MRDQRVNSPPPWHIPIAFEDIVETGQHFDLTADADVRAAVARHAGLRDLPRLVAGFDVTRHGIGGLHVVGQVSATVGQNCVVTLEPLAYDVEEDIDLRFTPQLLPDPQRDETVARREPRDVKWNDPEPLIGGVIDLGVIATEFLILGLNTYPRKPGAVFEPPQDVKPDAGAFAALARLTKGRDGH